MVASSLRTWRRATLFRVWLEYIADWPLLERSEADLLALAERVGLAASMTLKRDATGLAILASISKR
jgi:hypothetical protein